MDYFFGHWRRQEPEDMGRQQPSSLSAGSRHHPAPASRLAGARGGSLATPPPRMPQQRKVCVHPLR